jgi:hypothetical protein
MSSIPAFSPIRRAVCALSAGPARATGWLVSSKGLFVTSHAALGYHVEVEIENDAGERRSGRVSAVDVARDLAFVAAAEVPPRGSEPMAPLALRDVPAALVGDRVFAVAALPGRGLRVSPVAVCALPTRSGPSELIDTDGFAIGPAGGPLVDLDGRAIGLLVRSPAARDLRQSLTGNAHPAARRALALPSSEIRAALRPVEAAPDLPRRSPIYRCPTCTAPFVPDLDACLACGTPLPHPFPPDPSRPLAERAIHDALAAAGVVANRARVGPRSWQLPPRSMPGGEAASILVELDAAGSTVAFRAPVGLAPKAAREPFYRLLLTLNDQSTGAARLALDGDRVALVLALPLSMLEGRDVPQELDHLVEMAEHYRKILHEGFDAAPLVSLDPPPEW